MMGPEEGIDVSDPLQLVVVTYVVMAVVMGFLWAVQRKTKNAPIVDVACCAGLIAAVLSYMTQAPAGVERISPRYGGSMPGAWAHIYSNGGGNRRAAIAPAGSGVIRVDEYVRIFPVDCVCDVFLPFLAVLGTQVNPRWSNCSDC